MLLFFYKVSVKSLGLVLTINSDLEPFIAASLGCY